MFKQFIIFNLSIVVFYYFSNFYLKKKESFILINNKVKYPLKSKLKYTAKENIKNIKNLKNIVFYTTDNCELDYIYNKKKDEYYLIEPGYYYFINDNPDLITNFNSNLNVFYSKIK
jgi:hypothetical protein